MAGMVNHAMNNQMVKITDSLIGTWYCDGKRGKAEEEKRTISC